MRLWDLKSGAYHALRRLPGIGWILGREKRNLSALLSSLPGSADGTVDAGTGAGSTLDVFPESVRLICLDRSAAMLRRARKRRSFAAVVGDVGALPFRKYSVRLLSLIGVLEYLPDPGAFLGEAARVLRPEGYLLVTVSPSRMLNRMRILLGHRLHLVRQTEWEESLRRAGFAVLDRKHSLLQIQYLNQKTERGD